MATGSGDKVFQNSDFFKQVKLIKQRDHNYAYKMRSLRKNNNIKSTENKIL